MPKWHPESNRWRSRIGYHFGEKGRRVQKSFWWPGQKTADGQPALAVIADAVSKQDEWRKIEKDWPKVREKLEAVQPERDWSRAVWYDQSLTEKYDAAQKAILDQAVQQVFQELEEQEEREAKIAAQWLMRNGVTALMDRLVQPMSYADHPNYHPGYHTYCQRRVEAQQATAIAELRPYAERQMVKPVTIREALVASIERYKQRTEYETDRKIEPKTSDSYRKNLCALFGLSSAPEMNVTRDTGVNVEDSLHDLNQTALRVLALFWHKKPQGVTSTQTVRNYLLAGRKFLNFCEDEKEFGWEVPDGILEEFTAASVETPAMPYEPENIRKILARGGIRLKVFCLLGLTCGYYQMDCVEIMGHQYYADSDHRYLKRFRSKEDKPKRGRRPIAVRHWIAPELAALLDAERNNVEGVLFNSSAGTSLTELAVTGVWRRACEKAGVHLPFKQLRKIGYNAIKHVSRSLGVGDLWEGHSLGTNDAYDDGIFEPVNEAERMWCEVLRRDGIL